MQCFNHRLGDCALWYSPLPMSVDIGAEVVLLYSIVQALKGTLLMGSFFVGMLLKLLISSALDCNHSWLHVAHRGEHCPQALVACEHLLFTYVRSLCVP